MGKLTVWQRGRCSSITKGIVGRKIMGKAWGSKRIYAQTGFSLAVGIMHGNGSDLGGGCETSHCQLDTPNNTISGQRKGYRSALME